jgi:chitinase
MKNCSIQAILCGLVLLDVTCPGLLFAQPGPTNRLPSVSILWPREADRFSCGTLIKIKAQATDIDGHVTQVRFFAETNLIGISTNPPFNVLWEVGGREHDPDRTWTLKAVAVDNLGATNQSIPVIISYYTGLPTFPVVEIVSPPNGAMFGAPATFNFSAEVLASLGDTGPVEYFVGTNSVGVFDQVTTSVPRRRQAPSRQQPC